MKNNLRNFFKRLGRVKFMFFCFFIFAAISYYFNSWSGVVAAAFGWLLGSAIYNRRENSQRIKHFLNRYTNFQIKGMIFVPIAMGCAYFQGFYGFLAVMLGWCIGELISRRIFK